MRSSVAGCVLKRLAKVIRAFFSGLMMNRCAVAGVASSIGRACVA